MDVEQALSPSISRRARGSSGDKLNNASPARSRKSKVNDEKWNLEEKISYRML